MNIAQAANSQMATAYANTRAFSEQIAQPLSPEDCMVQSMPDTSPTRWHLAHTTWFFETFVLAEAAEYQVFDPQYGFLFNSYYNTVGSQFPRPQRGLISRPGLSEILDYRRYVDRQMATFLQHEEISDRLRRTIEIGIHHEQQHQELMLTDIKHVLSCNPTLPAYKRQPLASAERPMNSLPQASHHSWIDYPAELVEVGVDENASNQFSYDNESPRHRVYLHDYAIADFPVNCGQFIEFIEDGGYQRPDHWLSMGWSTCQQKSWDAPLYWVQQDRRWMQFTLAGLKPVVPSSPICHISYFEADAFARWAGYRLPTEFEWEHASSDCPILGFENQFADQLFENRFAIHPSDGGSGPPATRRARNTIPAQMFGGVWEWTSSSYAPYPGYHPPSGAMGEYNGKFMCNQYVLRGGSVATSSNHIRQTYRNFFPPEARWQFSGCRLAKSN